MRGWYQRHVALDSAPLLDLDLRRRLARMLAAIAAGDGEPWVARVLLDGEYGLHDVAPGVPVTLGPGGVERDPGVGARPPTSALSCASR